MEMPLSSRQKKLVENRRLADLLVNFGATVEKNQRWFLPVDGCSSCAQPAQMLTVSDGACLLVMFDNGVECRAGFVEQATGVCPADANGRRDYDGLRRS